MRSRSPNLQQPAGLLAACEQIRDEIGSNSQTILARWPTNAVTPGFRAAARNLAAYLALRQMDLVPMQTALSGLGLSSLGRSEGQVMANLDAVYASLARIAGAGAPRYPSARRLSEGQLALARAQQRLFGARRHGPYTRVMVTLPTELAVDDGVLAHALVAAGMTCARINCAHDNAATWRAMAANVRKVSIKLGRDCRVLMDIAGPKCRIETVHLKACKHVFRGDHIALVRNSSAARKADKTVATITFPDILTRLIVGAEVSINDGRIGTKVIACDGDRVLLEVTTARDRGERLRVEKGVNFPGTTIDQSPLTDKDRADLDTVAEIADIVGFSFVQNLADVGVLHSELARRRVGLAPLPLMLKIETALAVRNLPDLIMAAASVAPVAVMIARGDLAVELGFARLSEIQEEIMWLCEAAHVPVVWATQVLDSLVSDGLPTRAEATDAAMSQRAECVMLNKGPYAVDAVRFLIDILHRMDRHQNKKSPRFGRLRSWEGGMVDTAAPASGRAATLPGPSHKV